MNYLINMFEAGNYKTCSLCIFLVLQFSPTLITDNFHRSIAGKEFLLEFLDHPEKDAYKEILQSLVRIAKTYQELDAFLELPRKNQRCVNLVKIITVEEINIEDFENVFYPDLIQRKWKIIKDLIGDEKFKEFIFKLIEQKKLAASILADFSTENSALYRAIYAELDSTPRAREFSKILCEKLREINQNTWLNGLETENELLGLLIDLIGQRAAVGLEKDFADACYDYCLMVLRNEIKPKRYFSEWKTLPDGLKSEAEKDYLARKILAFVSSEAAVYHFKFPDSFFELYGGLIARPIIVMENIKIVSSFFTALVERQNLSGLEWLRQLFSGLPDLLDGYKDDPEVAAFEGQVSVGIRAAGSQNVKALLEAIAKTLGLETGRDG